MFRMNFLFRQSEFLFELQPLCTKVDQQPDVFSRGNQIIHRLNFVSRRQIMNRFQFDDEFVLDQKIGSKFTDQNTVINDIQWFF